MTCWRVRRYFDYPQSTEQQQVSGLVLSWMLFITLCAVSYTKLGVLRCASKSSVRHLYIDPRYFKQF